MIDAHSKWPEVFIMTSATSSKTTELLHTLFSSYGLPEQIVTDNGSQFISAEFQEFLQNNGVKHIYLSPYHPSSNGQVERIVQIFKRAMMVNTKVGQSRLAQFLLSYRCTPHSTTGVAASELFLNIP